MPIRDQERTERRYRFVLPRVADACADVARASDAADLVFVTHGLIDDAGLREPLPELVETLHLLVMEVAPTARRADLPVKCREVFTLYVSARFDGMRPAAAREGVAAVVKGIYKAATETAEPEAVPAAPVQIRTWIAEYRAPDRGKVEARCLPNCALFVNLADADLRGAILYKADLRGADLTEAKLNGANLIAADLSGATLPAGGEGALGCDKGGRLPGCYLRRRRPAPRAALVVADPRGHAWPAAARLP